MAGKATELYNDNQTTKQLLLQQIQMFEKLLKDSNGREVAYRRVHYINRLIRDIEEYSRTAYNQHFKDIIIDLPSQVTTGKPSDAEGDKVVTCTTGMLRVLFGQEADENVHDSSHDRTNEISKIAMEGEQDLQYTFDVDKSGNKVDDNNDNKNNDSKIINFEKPYSNIKNGIQLEEKKTKNVFAELDKFLNKQKQSMSTKSLAVPKNHQTFGQDNQHNYSISMREITDNNREIWQKSHELLAKLNSDRSIRVKNSKSKKPSSKPSNYVEDVISQISNYKLEDEYFINMKSNRKASENSRSKHSASTSTLKVGSKAHKEKTRNNTGRSHTEITMRSQGTPPMILYNKEMINQMLKYMGSHNQEQDETNTNYQL